MLGDVINLPLYMVTSGPGQMDIRFQGKIKGQRILFINIFAHEMGNTANMGFWWQKV
jgi:hypothetical protein